MGVQVVIDCASRDEVEDLVFELRNAAIDGRIEEQS